MTFLGKLLVLANFALSLAILAVALASFSNPVDFTNNPAKDGNPPGKFKVNADRLRDAWEKIVPAIVGETRARASLQNFDPYRDAHDFFVEELKWLREGATTDDNPARAIKYNLAQPELQPRSGKLVMEKAQDLAGKPLMSMAFYEKAIVDLAKDIKVQEDRFRQGVIDETMATQKRLGGKGFQQRLTDMQAMLAQAKEEAGRLEPLLINAMVESELILKRRASLEARLDELKKVEKATGPALGRTER
jgi:hypothetical protein